MARLRAGVVGCGAISGKYLENMAGRFAYCLDDVMHAIHDASREGRHVAVESTVERPAPFRPGLGAHVLE
jgi:predicted dehydrogenase